jgi:hypothetical protein
MHPLIPHKNISMFFNPICFVGGSCFINVIYIFVYAQFKSYDICVINVTRQMSLVEQAVLTLLKHLS